MRSGCFLAGMLCSLLAACGGDDARALQQARDAMAATLPAAHVEDLVIESVSIEGDALVQVIRSPGGNAIKTREHPRFEELRQDEQDDLRLLCAHPALERLLDSDVRLARRFLDREDNVFFEVEMPASACGATPP
ncbi:hypothetical protein E2F46_13145 [Luteimonas aestuarii]|uniref:Uncharacterized protein n=1 Tax=Luteimonas aestuarii TaxID=453837 RepID=A0A4R5TT43_9GAMM|nr:hypothetical protein [Luteimonas aestuarii]TDK22703.1 hypothetical protein E2F46_13145 [Luteimonas aestuarii]